MFNRAERLFGHNETETWFILLIGSAVESIWAMNESLTQEVFLSDEGASCKILSANDNYDSNWR